MNESNRRAGISPVSFGLFIVIVLFTLWVIGQNQMRKQEMTYPRFCQEVAAGNMDKAWQYVAVIGAIAFFMVTVMNLAAIAGERKNGWK